jgi:hypothetical protein
MPHTVIKGKSIKDFVVGFSLHYLIPSSI